MPGYERLDTDSIKITHVGLPAFAGEPPKIKDVRVSPSGRLTVIDYDFTDRQQAELPDFVKNRKQVASLPPFARRNAE